jgi:hypothetical protein
METLTINILNPKMESILKEFESLKLISILPNSKEKFKFVLSKIRSKSDSKITLEEIQREVDMIRERDFNDEKN